MGTRRPAPFAAHIAAHVTSRITATPVTPSPFPHWSVNHILPSKTAEAITRLPIESVAISETYGKRDSHNALRQFFSPEKQALYPVCQEMAEAFQMPVTIRALQTHCKAQLEGMSLRIEYCQDTEGFWLEPHTDIGAKVFTCVLYLTEGAEHLNMGTDIYDEKHHHVGRAPSPFNSGLIFIPSDTSWHGFEKRQMPQVRRSLIINYVKPEWRARHELCFPECPVKA
jgi:hypothetical protein